MLLEYSMSVKLVTERHFKVLSFKRGCKGSFESTVVKCHIVGNHMSRLTCIYIRLYLLTNSIYYIASYSYMYALAIIEVQDDMYNVSYHQGLNCLLT